MPNTQTTTERAAVEQFARDYFDHLAPYVRLESVSAQHRGIQDTTDWLQQTFRELGASYATQWNEPGGNPAVFAQFKGASDHTILFYNHYDVQPPEPLAEWHSEPFEPTFLDDGTVRARGIGDDKGELMCRLTAVRYLQDHGGLPCNLKFVVEGEEEVGSGHFDDYVAHHADDLAADVCVWEGGSKNEQEHFTVTGGVKGILAFDLSVRTADVDLHSSLGAYVDNAAWRLIDALHSLRTPERRLAVDGYYDLVETMSAGTRAAVDRMDFDADGLRERAGLRQPFLRDDPKLASVNEPSLTVNGFESGYTGDGVKTVIPREAHAKLDCRLAQGQTPQACFDLIRAQLDRNGFRDVEMTFQLGEDPFRSDLDDPYFAAATDVAKAVYGTDNVRVVPNSAGGGPQAPVAATLGLPIVSVGCGYYGSGAHAPNESLRVRDYQQGAWYMVELMRRMGAK